MTLQEMRTALERMKGKAQGKRDEIAAAQVRMEEWEKQARASEQAQAIIQIVAKETQDQLRFCIEEPVSLAFNAVFDNALTMRMEFPVRRGRTECDMIFSDGQNEYTDLEFSDGGGALDVGAFGLQVAVLTLMGNRARPLLILDEPLRWLKGGDLPERGARMLHEVAHRLGITLLTVSHIPEQKAGADRLFHVTKGRDGVARVTMEDRRDENASL